MDLSVGVIVYLKSGSPPLTVSDRKQASPDIVNVEWFVDGEVKRDAFHKDCLRDEPVSGWSDFKYVRRIPGSIHWMT